MEQKLALETVEAVREEGLIKAGPQELLLEDVETIKDIGLQREREAQEELYRKTLSILAAHFFYVSASDIRGFDQKKREALDLMVHHRVKRFFRRAIGGCLAWEVLTAAVALLINPEVWVFFILGAVVCSIPFLTEYKDERDFLRTRRYLRSHPKEEKEEIHGTV